MVEYSKLSCKEKQEQKLTDCVDGDDYGFRVQSGPRDVNVQLVNVAGHKGEGQTFKINQILNYSRVTRLRALQSVSFLQVLSWEI